jgi:hypothetical protein
MSVMQAGTCIALVRPEMSNLFSKRHPYTGNLDSETSGDSKNAFLHCGDVRGRGIVTEALCHDTEHTFVCLRVLLQDAQDGLQYCILFLEPSHLQVACIASD